MDFPSSERLKKLPPYLFTQIDRKKKELLDKGEDVIDLGVGDPDLMPPAYALDRLASYIKDQGAHCYSPSYGIDEFRYIVAKWMKRRFGVELNPYKEITLAMGSKELVAHLPLALTDPGDIILIPDPGYPPYYSGTILAGCQPYLMQLEAKDDFIPNLRQIPKDVLKRAKVMFINYPNNPTTAVATRTFYQEVREFAEYHRILVVSDAAYSEIYYEQPPISFLQIEGAKEVGIEVHSMTKTLCMAGWRLAWAAGNAGVIERLSELKANLDSGQFIPLQKAAAASLIECEPQQREIRACYKERRDTLVYGLRRLGWDIHLPQATFYVWFSVPIKGVNSIDFATLILERTRVVVTPGVGFGPGGEGYIRCALVTPKQRIQEAVDRISEVM